MKIESMSVSNYRSIGKQTTFKIGNMTTLVGPNNEGKTNLIRALVVGMNLIRLRANYSNSDWSKSVYSPWKRYNFSHQSLRDEGYDWEYDFPLSKQKNKSGMTRIRVTFSLNETEVDEFVQSTGIRTNGTLPIQIDLRRDSATLSIVKQGNSKRNYENKAQSIAKFISGKINVIYVPAVRTEEQARRLLNNLLSIKVRSLFDDPQYNKLIEEINDKRRAIIEEIESTIRGSVSEYMTSVSRVHISTDRLESFSSRVLDVSIDDGFLTPLGQKGDGIKSLFTLALMQELSKEKSSAHSYLLIVDEPEAHLHPNAVRELQRILEIFSETQQVLVATHNPIMVNREDVSSNVLVANSTAKPVQRLAKIRESLGVQVSDNLSSAEIVILVEGPSDVQIISNVLKKGVLYLQIIFCIIIL